MGCCFKENDHISSHQDMLLSCDVFMTFLLKGMVNGTRFVLKWLCHALVSNDKQRDAKDSSTGCMA